MSESHSDKNLLRVGCSAVITYSHNNITYVAMVLRGRNCRNNWGNWQLVGGGCESNETPIECIIREIKEEIGLNVKIIGYQPNYFLKTDDGNWFNISFECDCISPPHELSNNEPHKFDEVKWIPINKLPTNTSELTKRLIEDYHRRNCDPYTIDIVDDYSPLTVSTHINE